RRSSDLAAYPGRMIRTPTFTLDERPLFYLVRGTGSAYAAVDSHRLNHGPLHGALALKWKGSEQLQWVRHNLQRYAGHRAHVEFSAPESGDFEVLSIVQAAQEPKLNSPNAIL